YGYGAVAGPGLATPPELGHRPLALDFYLGPHTPRDFPRDIVASAGPPREIDPALYAALAVEELLTRKVGGKPWREHVQIPPELLSWQKGSKYTAGEITHLFYLMRTQRERYLAEIVGQ